MSQVSGVIIAEYIIEVSAVKKSPFGKRAKRRRKEKLKRLSNKHFNLNQFLFIKRNISNA